MTSKMCSVVYSTTKITAHVIVPLENEISTDSALLSLWNECIFLNSSHCSQLFRVPRLVARKLSFRGVEHYGSLFQVHAYQASSVIHLGNYCDILLCYLSRKLLSASALTVLQTYTTAPKRSRQWLCLLEWVGDSIHCDFFLYDKTVQNTFYRHRIDTA